VERFGTSGVRIVPYSYSRQYDLQRSPRARGGRGRLVPAHRTGGSGACWETPRGAGVICAPIRPAPIERAFLREERRLGTRLRRDTRAVGRRSAKRGDPPPVRWRTDIEGMSRVCDAVGRRRGAVVGRFPAPNVASRQPDGRACHRLSENRSSICQPIVINLPRRAGTSGRRVYVYTSSRPLSRVVVAAHRFTATTSNPSSVRWMYRSTMSSPASDRVERSLLGATPELSEDFVDDFVVRGDDVSAPGDERRRVLDRHVAAGL